MWKGFDTLPAFQYQHRKPFVSGCETRRRNESTISRACWSQEELYHWIRKSKFFHLGVWELIQLYFFGLNSTHCTFHSSCVNAVDEEGQRSLTFFASFLWSRESALGTGFVSHVDKLIRSVNQLFCLRGSNRYWGIFSKWDTDRILCLRSVWIVHLYFWALSVCAYLTILGKTCTVYYRFVQCQY